MWRKRKKGERNRGQTEVLTHMKGQLEKQKESDKSTQEGEETLNDLSC